MDHNAIVDEILRRVAEKISEAEAAAPIVGSAVTAATNPGLLILTQDHGTACHAMLESREALKAHYQHGLPRSCTTMKWI